MAKIKAKTIFNNIGKILDNEKKNFVPKAGTRRTAKYAHNLYSRDLNSIKAVKEEKAIKKATSNFFKGNPWKQAKQRLRDNFGASDKDLNKIRQNIKNTIYFDEQTRKNYFKNLGSLASAKGYAHTGIFNGTSFFGKGGAEDLNNFNKHVDFLSKKAKLNAHTYSKTPINLPEHVSDENVKNFNVKLNNKYYSSDTVPLMLPAPPPPKPFGSAINGKHPDWQGISIKSDKYLSAGGEFGTGVAGMKNTVWDEFDNSFGSAVTGGKNSVWNKINGNTVDSPTNIKVVDRNAINQRIATYKKAQEEYNLKQQNLSEAASGSPITTASSSSESASESVQKAKASSSNKISSNNPVNDKIEDTEDYAKQLAEAEQKQKAQFEGISEEDIPSDTAINERLRAEEAKNGPGFSSESEKFAGTEYEPPPEEDDSNASWFSRVKKRFTKEPLKPKTKYQKGIWNELDKTDEATLDNLGVEGYDQMNAAEKYHANRVVRETNSLYAKLRGVENEEDLKNALRSQNIKIQRGESLTDAISRSARENMSKGASGMDYFMGYHGPTAVAAGAIGFAALKAVDFGGPKTNAELYGNPFA